MNVLVTGGSGFVGSFLTETLVQKGYRVTCLVRHTSDLGYIRHLDIEFLYADLCDRDAYGAELGRFDYIYHAAGITKAGSEKEYFHANAEGTESLIRAASESCPGVKRFLLVSSLAAAGPSLDGDPLTEEAEPHPVSAYGRSKLQGEKAVLAYRDRVPITIVRPPAVYGPRDRDFFLIFQAVRHGIFPYWGRCFYSLIHVEDLVKGLILCAEQNRAEGKTYYLADRRIYSNDDILAGLSAALGKKAFRLRLPRSILPIVAALTKKKRKKGIINPDKIQEIRYSNWTCNPLRAEKDLGFSTTMPLEQGLRNTAEWYRKEKWL